MNVEEFLTVAEKAVNDADRERSTDDAYWLFKNLAEVLAKTTNEGTLRMALIEALAESGIVGRVTLHMEEDQGPGHALYEDIDIKDAERPTLIYRMILGFEETTPKSACEALGKPVPSDVDLAHFSYR